ncbi:hypothetical protein QKW60_05525 [Defluviimonas aestuarii]|uniref:beta strand repeat-containing protein n=1 Tax=Albidovulum aestuarii TaxID=1130726 RepID=UPI00249A3F39|nr:LamG-like jellyroll fold domain-containing protein [Defluviimonas aestuarii]MDI3335856.1 hypothetical protein [Defluviimonas aestuarii]
MAQFLRPDADVAISSWAGTPTTSGIYQNVDEATASNTDFVYSGNNPNGSGCELGLSNPGSTPGSGTCTVRWRDAWLNGTALNSSGTAVDLDVQLLQGATVIASSGVHAVTGAWTARSFTFAASAVSDWNDLRIKFVATGGGGSPANRRGAGVSWAEVETPDGSVTITGTGAGSQPLSGTGGGSVDDTGTGAGSAALTGSGAGSVDDQGAGSGSMPLSGSGGGYVLTSMTEHPTLMTGLVSAWELDEVSDGSVAVARIDSHGPNDLDDNGTVPSANISGTEVAVFDRANNEFLSISDAQQVGLGPSGSFAVAFAFQLDSFNPSGSNTILVIKNNGAINERSFFLTIRTDVSDRYFELAASSSGTSNFQSGVDVTAQIGSGGAPHTGVMSFDAPAGAADFYIDGSLIGRVTGFPTSLFDTSAPFQIGVSGDAGLDGWMKRVRFWGRTLTANEAKDYHFGGDGLPFDVVSEITGTGAGSTSLSGSGAGSVDDEGTGSGSQPIGGSGAGSVDDEGTGAGSLPLSGSGTGDVGAAPLEGTGDGSMPLSGTGAGSVEDEGDGAGTMPLSGSGAGDVADDGQGSGTQTLGGAASGSVDVEASGSGSAPLSGSAAGAVDDEGTGSGSFPLSGTGDGVVGSAPVEGVGAGSMPLSGAGAGEVADDGVGAGTAPLSGSGGGSVDDTGSGSGSAPLTGSGSGAVQDTGTGAGTSPLSGSGSASVDDTGTGSGASPLTGVGAGSVDDDGAGDGSMPLTGAGAGTVVDPAAINHIVLAGYRRPSFRAPGGMVAANAPGMRGRAKAIGGGS